MTAEEYEDRYWELNYLVLDLMSQAGLVAQKAATLKKGGEAFKKRENEYSWLRMLARHYERLMFAYQPLYAPKIGVIVFNL